MKLNLEEQEETIEPVEKTDLIYGIDDRPLLRKPCLPLYNICWRSLWRSLRPR